jgi:hypothetical protein
MSWNSCFVSVAVLLAAPSAFAERTDESLNFDCQWQSTSQMVEIKVRAGTQLIENCPAVVVFESKQSRKVYEINLMEFAPSAPECRYTEGKITVKCARREVLRARNSPH